MKRYLLIFVFFVITFYSQENETVISAKEVLQLQIEQAKLKAEKMISDTSEIVNTKPVLVKKSSTLIIPNIKEKQQTIQTQEVVNNSQLLKIFILVEVFLLSLIVIAYIRRKRYLVQLDEKELKANIKNLRSERALIYQDNELSSLRQKLSKLNINIKDGAKSITGLAKKLQIGKGEIHLAAKLKLLMDKK